MLFCCNKPEREGNNDKQVNKYNVAIWVCQWNQNCNLIDFSHIWLEFRKCFMYKAVFLQSCPNPVPIDSAPVAITSQLRRYLLIVVFPYSDHSKLLLFLSCVYLGYCKQINNHPAQHFYPEWNIGINYLIVNTVLISWLNLGK